MKKTITVIIAAILLFSAFSVSETVLQDGWENASLDELKSAASLIGQAIEKKEALLSLQANEVSPVFFEQGGVTLQFNGLRDTNTSGLNFQPDIFLNNASGEKLTVSASDFYVNCILMSVSNLNSITLEPNTSLELTTKNIWLLSARDLIDAYGVSTIESIAFKLTVKLGSETLVNKQPYTFRTGIDIFDMMRGNYFFPNSYPTGYRPEPLNTDSMSLLFEKENVNIYYNGLVDTNTSGLNFQPDMYFENNSEQILTVSAGSFYVNGILMSASNSGSITLEPHTRLMLSTRNSWLLSAGDLIDVYRETTIRNFTVKLTVKLGDATLVSQQPFSIDENTDIFKMMQGNYFFPDTYPYGYKPEPLDISSMLPVYMDHGVCVYYNGLLDTHTSGLNFHPDMYFENNTDQTFSISANRFIINGIPMSVSNGGSITLEPHTRLMLSTRNSWLLSARDLIDVYGEDSIRSFVMHYTLKLGNDYLVQNEVFKSDKEISLFDLMGSNYFFPSTYPADYVCTPLDTASMTPVFERSGVRILFDGLQDTHTSGLNFQPVLYFENNTDETLSVSPSDFYVNNHLMSTSNSGSVTLEPHTRYMLSTNYSWLMKAADLIDTYKCDRIESFSVKLTIKLGNTVLEKQLPAEFAVDYDIYDLMGGNSFFTDKYKK